MVSGGTNKEKIKIYERAVDEIGNFGDVRRESMNLTILKLRKI